MSTRYWKRRTAKRLADRFKLWRIDWVITDLAMPEQDGTETIKILRKLRPELKIIAISGRFVGPMLRIAEYVGAGESLAKPIRPDEFLAAVSRVMAR